MRGRQMEKREMLSGLRRIVLKAILFLLAAALIPAVCIPCSRAAGEQQDTASIYNMSPGETLDISQFSHATYVEIAGGSGTYVLRGKSSRCTVEVKAKAGEQIRVIFGDPSGQDRNTGFRLVATKDCPGFYTIQRPALVAEGGEGARITLSSAPGTHCYFRSKADAIPVLGCDPAIRKFRYNYTLVFDTVDPDDPGTIEAVADPKGHRTAAIGGDDLDAAKDGLGNVVFENGIIIARGSERGDGGPGIGSEFLVDGLSFNNATVYAYAGGHAAAAIGTATGELIPVYADAYTVCRNITINGGEIHAVHEKTSYNPGGAGIGGGFQGNCENLTINGGTVYAAGNSGAAGIGGGDHGDAVNLVINGGTVYAQGSGAGIGSGYMNTMGEGCHGQFSITIREADPANPTVVTAIGGLNPDGSEGMDAPGIGGWLPLIEYKDHHGIQYDDIRDGKRSITIEGGRISAKGNGVGSGIGVGADGFVETLRISGGIIEAQGGEIGCALGGAVTKKGQYNGAGARWIIISGGTVRLTGADGSLGRIGACIVKDHHAIKRTTGHLIISGGNVAAEPFELTPRSSSAGYDVYRNDIAIRTYGTSGHRDRYVAVDALGIETEWPYYGMNDLYTLPESDEERPVLYLWLPEGHRITSVKTKTPYINYGYISRAEKQYEFFGNTAEKKGGMLYPPVCFLVDNNYNIRNLDFMPYVDVRIGSSSGEVRNPLSGTADYTLDEARTIPLVRADGSYFPNVVQGNVTWTDADGKMLISGSGSELDLRKRYTGGFQIFSIYTTMSIGFGEGKPAGASTDLSGTLPDRIPFESSQDSVALPSSAQLVLPGYELCGWNTAPDGSGTHFDLGARVTKEDVHYGHALTFTLYPEWKPREYTIVFRAGAGTGSPEHRQTALFDRAGTLDRISTFKEAGWNAFGTLHGWTHRLLGTVYEDGEDFVNLCDLDEAGVPAGRTLTAQWLSGGEIAVSVTLDGVGVPGLEKHFRAVAVANSTVFDLPMSTPAPGVYVFHGDTGGSLPPGDYHLALDDDTYYVPAGTGDFSYSGTSSVSVTLDFYTVSVARGPGEENHIAGISLREPGTGAARTSLVVPDDSRLLLEVLPARGRHLESLTVTGVPPDWEDPGNPAKESQMITVRGTAVITAYTGTNTYTVVFDPNGGTGTMENQEMAFGESRELFPVGFARNRWIWKEWNTAADGSGTSYVDRQTVQDLTAENQAVVRLYAIWEPEVYAVEYDLGGGRIPGGRANPATYTTEDSFTLINPERGSFIFTGWSGTGLSAETMQVTVPKGSGGDRSYRAHWKILKSCVVIFLDTGPGTAEGIPEPVIFYPGSAGGLKLPAAIPAKEGYWFAGWNTEEDGSGTKYMPGETAYIREDLILYAMWEPRGFTLTFDPAGGTLNGGTEPVRMACAFGTVITIPEAPVRNGWNFLFWKGSKYYPGDRYTVEGDHTFTAQWEPVPTPTPRPVPDTGDRENPAAWLLLLWAGLAVLCAVFLLLPRREKKP